MLTRLFSPLRASNAGYFRNMFHFSTESKPSKNLKETKTSEVARSAENESSIKNTNTYVYDTVRFKQINNEAFVKKIEEIERFNKYGSQKKADGCKVPIFLILAAAFIYHC